jgi:mannitol 2-dehydrogenase
MTDVTSDAVASAPETRQFRLSRSRVRPRRVSLPRYDRAALLPSVVHLGVGSFHRAHQAVYFDELAGRGESGWGVVGVGIARRELGRILAEQDNLFVVVQRGVEASSARVVGSMVDYLLLADDPKAVTRRLADPRTRLVTMTITGDGYATNDDGPESPVFAAVVTALDARRRAGHRPFTVLSCDNLPDSGAAARRATLAVARRRSPDLAAWIEDTVCFPAGMVDRITPQLTAEQRARIRSEFRITDRSPVVTEPFAQWVIEDCFTDGRPPLETVGVRFVDDVGPYKLIKSRLLNGTHSAIGYLGYLAGHRTTATALADPTIARFVAHLMKDEIAPGLPDRVPGMELDTYQAVLLDRFASPAIADQLERLCRRGSTKMVDYLLPSAHDAARAGRSRSLLALVVGAWCCYLRGRDLHGTPIEVEDPRADELQPLANQGPAALLAVRSIFGDLGQDAEFVDAVCTSVRRLDDAGVQAAIADVVEQG